MFDIGFSELVVIALVALVVIGPERLPKVARTLGHLLGRMQRYVNDVKADISREMELDELRKLQSTVEEAARSIEQSVHKEVSTAESQLNDITAAVTDLAPAAPAAEAVPAPPVVEAAPPVTPSAAAPASPQLELGLDAAGEASRKQA
jgi:sec-independent protein translocase protein TatB